MAQAVIRRWGRNQAIRLPAEAAKTTGLGEGQRVEIEVIVRKLPAELAAGSMFSGRSPSDWRALYRAAYDWGEDRGRERGSE
jgi:Antidote-toxin recognition MazE, bacterial antitoxin